MTRLRFVDGLITALEAGAQRLGFGGGMGRPALGGRALYAMTRDDVAGAYYGLGLMRKIISIPADDMVREWRGWKAGSDQITKIEAEEARLGLVDKVRQAEVLRGCGGGAFVLGLPGNPDTPAPAKIAAGRLEYIHVVSRWQLEAEHWQTDPTKPGYGEPLHWFMTVENGSRVRIHPSRVIPFRADTLPGMVATSSALDAFWGESKVAQVLEAVTDCDKARTAARRLIEKARLTRVGIPGLAELLANGGEATLAARMQALAVGENLYSVTVFDKGGMDADGNLIGEEIKDTDYTFAGLKDMLDSFGEWASAISDIPATRLLGRAPEGMNSSGSSQQVDWNKAVRSRQTRQLKPCLDRMDPWLIQSALGALDSEIWADFNPLEAADPDKAAARLKATVEAVEKLQNTSLIPEIALTKAVQSLLVDSGYLPALEQALNELPDDERWGLVPDDGGAEQGSEPDDTVVPFKQAANDGEPEAPADE